MTYPFPSYNEAHYTYLTTDLRTNTVLGEIPLHGVTLDCQLNTPGNMTAGANLDDPRIADADFISRTIPGRTAFWAYRENKIVWGGIIWTRQWEAQGKTFTFSGQTFESYATRRFPKSWLGSAMYNYNAGQCFIINDLWLQLQRVTYGDIGVRPMTSFPPNDFVRQVLVNGWDLSTSFDDIIQAQLAYSNSPDYTIQWLEDGNSLPIKQLVVAPVIGNPIASTDLVIDFPGSVADYIYNENASTGNTVWWAVGDGSGAQQWVGAAEDTASLQAGFPLLEGVNSYSGVTSTVTLDQYAQADLAALPVLYTVNSPLVFGARSPVFGTYSMGDYCVMHAKDGRFPLGATYSRRVIGWSITPPDEGQGAEEITLVLSDTIVPDTTGG